MQRSFHNLFIILLLLQTLFCYCDTTITTDIAPFTFDYSQYGLNKKALKRAEKLDSIFDNTKLGEIHLTITEEEWNKLLELTHKGDGNYDQGIYIKSACHFEKENKTYNMKEIGLRIRGNTSRRPPAKIKQHNNNRPQYQQVSFRLKFTEYHDKKYHLEKALKGMNLKFMRNDSSYVQEVYSYDLLRRFGLWTAALACFVKLYITVESSDKAYFGVYKSIEQINKQYIKARVGDNAFSDDTGNLWKCGGANLINENLDEYIGQDYWDGEKYISYKYELKTNDKNEQTRKFAYTQFKAFIENLNTKQGSDFESWIASAFDVDSFLKTLAVNVTVGMWDDYWNNKNNYYLYFDGSGKCFFIPHDYDSTLGPYHPRMNNITEMNPLSWGDSEAPLVDKILAIEKYREQYKRYLTELIDKENALFNVNASEKRIKQWYNQIEDACDKNLYDASYNANLTDKKTLKELIANMLIPFGFEWFGDMDIKKGKSTKECYILGGGDSNYFVRRTNTIRKAIDEDSCK